MRALLDVLKSFAVGVLPVGAITALFWVAFGMPRGAGGSVLTLCCLLSAWGVGSLIRETASSSWRRS